MKYIDKKFNSFKRVFSLLLSAVILFSALFFSSCGENNDNIPDNTPDLSSAPPANTEITGLSENAEFKNIISAAPAATSALIKLGCGEFLYAADTYSYNIENRPSELPLYDMFNTSVEQLSQGSQSSAAPDLFVTIEGFADSGLIEALKTSGSCAVIVFPKINTVDTLRSFVLYLGSITGTSEKAEQIITELDTLITDVKEAASAVETKKSVYIELSDETPHPIAGGDSLLTEIVELCGGINVFKSKTAENSKYFAEASTEDIVAQNPDVIFTANRFLDDPCDEILSRKDLITVNALISNEVYKLPTSASMYPSADIADVIRTIAFYLCSYTAE